MALGVPAEIIAKPPSADLWPGQTDEGELGRSYADLDRALFALVDRRWSVERCVAAGLDPWTLVDWVARRVAAMEFKRQVPPVAKVVAAHAGDRPSLPAPPAGVAPGPISGC